LADYNLSISVPDDGLSHIITVSGLGAGANDLTCSIWFTQIYTDMLKSALSSGAISLIRPVSMSLYGTDFSSQLNDGGMIAAAYLCSDTYRRNYLSQNPSQQVGDLHQWENITKLPSDGRRYDGPIRNGEYVYWVPEGPENSDWLTPDQMNAAEFPTLVLAGIAQLNTPPVSAFCPPFMRVKIERVYEIQSNTGLWETQMCVGSQAHIDAAFRQLACEPRAMANSQHEPFLKRMGAWLSQAAGKVGKFYSANASWINPAVMAGLSIL